MRAIGVDVGGTFTDLVYCDLDTGEVVIHKVVTTPKDPSQGVMKGIRELCTTSRVGLEDIDVTAQVGDWVKRSRAERSTGLDRR